MRTPEAIKLKINGIDPLPYKIDPNGGPAMQRYQDTLRAVCSRKDCTSGQVTTASTFMDRDDAIFLEAIGQTLSEAGLPHATITRVPRSKAPFTHQDIVTAEGTGLEMTVQGYLHTAAQEYRRAIAGQQYTPGRKEELLDEFVLRGVREASTILTGFGWHSKETVV